jgi:hypothetical protein
MGPFSACLRRVGSSYSDSSRVGNGEGSTEPRPPRIPGTVGNNGAAGSGLPVVPVRLAPERARAALPVDPAAPVRLASVGVARAPVRPELLRPVRRPVLRFAAGRRFAVVRFAAGRRLAVVRFAAVFRFGAAFRLVAVLRFAVLRFAAVFRLGAAFRLVAVFRLAVVRFAAVFRFGAAFRFVAVLRFAVVRFAVLRFAVVRFAAGRRFAVDRFAAVRFVPVRFLVAICLLLLGEFGGNDSAQYAPCIGRFHHPEGKILRYLEILSLTSPFLAADTCFAMCARATIPASITLVFRA